MFIQLHIAITLAFVGLFDGISNSTVLNKVDSTQSCYESAYRELENILVSPSNELSFKKAIYIVENAYYEGKLNRDIFENGLKTFASYCNLLASNQIVNYSGEDFESVNKHAAIFKLMADTVSFILNDSTYVIHLPFKYNFDDYAGNSNWENTFVVKLLSSNRGTCHSLPILYKLIAEEMGEKAWLSLAPNHFYIKLRNKQSGWYNTELTSAQFPSDVWLKSSGYIHLDAITNGIYMDTLSLRNSVALCLIDLAQGYQHKYPDSYEPEFVLKCCNTALLHFPNYINALLLKAETLLEVYKKNKNNSVDDYKKIEELYAYIHKLGYRKMPDKMYLEWLSSLKDVKGVYQFKSQ